MKELAIMRLDSWMWPPSSQTGFIQEDLCFPNLGIGSRHPLAREGVAGWLACLASTSANWGCTSQKFPLSYSLDRIYGPRNTFLVPELALQ